MGACQMTKNSAEQVKAGSLKAIECLTQLLNDATAGYSTSELERLHKTVGLLIGKVQVEVLAPINETYPELDDLA